MDKNLYGVWRGKPARYNSENDGIEYWEGAWCRLGIGYDSEFRVFVDEARGNEDQLFSLELKTTEQ